MLPTAFSVAEGETVAMGAIFDVDTDSGRVRDVRRIRF
jgi:hypothetical protein